jgi:LL-diaminopimelate aminotransferase
MYHWIPIPKSYIDERKNSFDFARDLLEATGVALVPGLTFGKFGEDYVRLALVQPLDKIKIAMEKFQKFTQSKLVV